MEHENLPKSSQEMLCCWSGDRTHNCLSRSIQYLLNRRQQLPVVLKEAETIQRSKKDLPGTVRQAEGKGFLVVRVGLQRSWRVGRWPGLGEVSVLELPERIWKGTADFITRWLCRFFLFSLGSFLHLIYLSHNSLKDMFSSLFLRCIKTNFSSPTPPTKKRTKPEN